MVRTYPDRSVEDETAMILEMQIIILIDREFLVN